MVLLGNNLHDDHHRLGYLFLLVWGPDSFFFCDIRLRRRKYLCDDNTLTMMHTTGIYFDVIVLTRVRNDVNMFLYICVTT